MSTRLSDRPIAKASVMLVIPRYFVGPPVLCIFRQLLPQKSDGRWCGLALACARATAEVGGSLSPAAAMVRPEFEVDR
jgi:hypothetical protein